MVLSEKMNIVYYLGGSAITWYLTKNVAYKSTDALVSYIMNSDADPNLKNYHMVKSIGCMIHTYEDMTDDHPAYESMLALKDALKDLSDTIDTIKLKIHVHNNSYLSKFRTYDARGDNVLIQQKVDNLMIRLDLFTKLLKLKKQ